MAEAIPTVAIIGTRGYPSYYGGFETAVRRMAPYLTDHGWRVRVYERTSHVAAGSAADSRVEVVATRGIDSTSLSTLTYGFTSVLHCMRHKADVALVMNVANGFWLPLLRLRGVRTVVNVDGIEWHRQKWSGIGRFVFKVGAWLTAKFADELVVDALAIGDYWKRTLGRSGTFIPYGADELPALKLQDELTPKKNALLVARFVPENSVSEFIEAAAEISREFDVVLVGSAPPGHELNDLAEAAARENPRIHWLGHINDDDRLFALWQNAGAYFHGHSVGGTNPALVQAMALQVPIVARDTVYNREVLNDGGRYCAAEPSAISATVLDVLQHDPGTTGIALQRVRSIYNWAEVNAAYDRVLRRNLRPGPRNPGLE